MPTGARAGQAAAGALLDTETGYGKYIGLSAMPSTQGILGIVVMFTLNREITPQLAPEYFAIGVLAGLALMSSAMFQARLLFAINTIKNKPEVFGFSHCASGNC